MSEDLKNLQVNPGHFSETAPKSTALETWGMFPEKSWEETYTCICCPLGCSVHVTLVQDASGLSVEDAIGYGCRRGRDYARQEATHPVRMITAAVPVQGRLCPVSVKTSEAVPKDRMRHVLDALGTIEAVPPIQEGQVLIANVCGTGCDVVATKAIL